MNLENTIPPKARPPLLSQRLFRTSEAAHYLGISAKALRRLVLAGEISVVPGPSINSPWMFDKADLDRYIERRKVSYPRKKL